MLDPDMDIAPDEATDMLPVVAMTKLLEPPRVKVPTPSDPEVAVFEKIAVAPTPVKFRFFVPFPKSAALNPPALTV